jgi:hypothetical protein
MSSGKDEEVNHQRKHDNEELDSWEMIRGNGLVNQLTKSHWN